MPSAPTLPDLDQALAAFRPRWKAREEAPDLGPRVALHRVQPHGHWSGRDCHGAGRVTGFFGPLLSVLIVTFDCGRWEMVGRDALLLTSPGMAWEEAQTCSPAS